MELRLMSSLRNTKRRKKSFALIQFDQDRNLRNQSLDFYRLERSQDRNLFIKNERLLLMIFLMFLLFKTFDPYYKTIKSLFSHSSFVKKNIGTFSDCIFRWSKLGNTRIIKVKPLISCWISIISINITCNKRYSDLLP